MIDLGELRQSEIDGRTKGFPGGIGALRLSEIGKKGWNLLREDVPLPAAVLKRSALEHNTKWMGAFLQRTGAVIAPHGKTPMSPQLFDMQLEGGAWAITLATIQQVQVARRYGVKRIILANELVGKQALRYVLDEIARDPGFDFYCLVDSIDSVEILASAARARKPGRPVQVLLEGGFTGGRCGVRDLDAALKVARAARAASPHLALRGVEGFEGLLRGRSAAESAALVRGFLDFLVSIARAAEKEGLFAPGIVLLTAGGSAFYDLVAERFAKAGLKSKTQVVTRSGCYLSHDSQAYSEHFANMLERAPELKALGHGLKPSIELWTYVSSRPEPGKCLLTMGRRDVGTDLHDPVAQLWFRPGLHTAPQAMPGNHKVAGLNDQHTHLTIDPNSPLKVGDMVAFGISHPCTTFDKWTMLYVVNDGYDIIDAVKTFF